MKSLNFMLGLATVSWLFGCKPDSWESRTRKESIRVLSAITSTNQLQGAAGNGGVVLTLTNGSWIVIRNMVEYEPDRELAIARDSGGGWFESTNKFSGGLTWYPRFKGPHEPGKPIDATIECFHLQKIESASGLEEARELLQELLGFTPLNK